MTMKKKKNPLLILILTILALSSIFPFIYMLIISFMETSSMKLNWNRLLNAKWTIDNYANIFSKKGNFLKYVLNSTIMSVYSCAVNCLVSAMAAYAFAKKKFTGSKAIYATYLMTMMIPSQALLIPQFLIVKNLGLLDTFTGLSLPYISAFGTILVHSFMKGVPDDLLDAADIDGCGEVRKFVSVVLPLIKPVLISLTIFTFISVWGDLIWPLVIGSGDKTTVTLAVASMKNELTSANYGAIMAASACAFMPPFALYIFLQKQFVEGIALSGIKG